MIELAVIIAAGSYVLWGIIHHAHHGDLHLKVVLEYVGLAILGVAAVLTVVRNL